MSSTNDSTYIGPNGTCAYSFGNLELYRPSTAPSTFFRLDTKLLRSTPGSTEPNHVIRPGIPLLEEWDKSVVESYTPASTADQTIYCWTSDGKDVPQPDDLTKLSKAAKALTFRIVMSVQSLRDMADETSEDEVGVEESKRLKDEAAALWNLKHGLDKSLVRSWNCVGNTVLEQLDDVKEAELLELFQSKTDLSAEHSHVAARWFEGARTDFRARHHDANQMFFRELKGFAPAGNEPVWSGYAMCSFDEGGRSVSVRSQADKLWARLESQMKSQWGEETGVPQTVPELLKFCGMDEKGEEVGKAKVDVASKLADE
ncbi:hypothetical protein IAT38_003394 [Cryptococcus sp. DSM 104549]